MLPVCPACGQATQRIPRLNQDRARSVSIRARRFGCSAASCAWQGLLLPADLVPEAEPAAPDSTPAGSGPLRWARAAVLGGTVVAAVGLPLTVATVVGLGALAGPPAALALLPGVSHDGLALRRPSQQRGGQLLPAQLVLTAAAAASGAAGATATTTPNTPAAAPLAPLALRQGCAWGQPGRNPYRGSTEQALHAAQLPDDVVRQVSAMRQAKQVTARLQIGTAGIHEVNGPREFASTGLALTFGNTLCLGSKINFAPGHTEAADLYEVRDSQGRLHAVMVPDVCGNVSVLQRRGLRGVVAGLAGALAQRSVALVALADALAHDGAGAADSADTTPGGDGGGDAAAGTDAAASAPTAGGQGAAAPANNAGRGRAAAADADVANGVAGAGTAVGLGGPATAAGAGPTADSGANAVAQRGTGSFGPAGFAGTALAGLTDLVLPRSVAVGGLGSLAKGLAQAGQGLSRVAVLVGDTAAPLPVTGRPAGTAQQSVPAPGTLACVLAGLAVLWRMRQRGRAARRA